MRRPGLALALALAGCAYDGWTFRPLADGADAGSDAATDARGSGRDGAADDAASTPEVSVADAPPSEVADGDVVGADAALAPDAAPDAPEVSAPPGLALRAEGFATTAAAPAAGGALRLVEGGFAWGARVCSDGLCMTGGLQ